MITIRKIFLLVALVPLLALCMPEPALSACNVSYCKAEQTVKKRTYIHNTSRQIIGDLYDPGTGRIQIRDTHRRIIGYIETNGRITNTSRQKVGAVNE